MKSFIKILIFVGILIGFSSCSKKSIYKDIKENQDYIKEMFESILEQYNSIYFHQGNRGGKGKWSNGIGGLPSPKIAKKYLISFIRSEPEEKLFENQGLKSFIRMCMNIINTFPRLHHGVGGGILIAINSYQEEEHNIVKGFCTEASMMYFFKKEMNSMITESIKPNSLVPPLTKKIFDNYEVGGNWSDFIENCEDILQEYKIKYSRKRVSDKWLNLDLSEISDFCEELADDIYPNIIISENEWSHIYNLQNYIIEKKGIMGSPILGIPKERPPYYVAGRHQSSMYRKCLRALWDMFQYDEDIDLKIAGKYQYETLRSFCDAAKNYYTRSGRISASPMINIKGHKKDVKRKTSDSIVNKILREQREKEEKEKVIALKLKNKFERQQNEKIKRSREIRKQTRQDQNVNEFPMEGILYFSELPTPTKKISPVTQKLPDSNQRFNNKDDIEMLVEDPENDQEQNLETDEQKFAIDIAREELVKFPILEE